MGRDDQAPPLQGRGWGWGPSALRDVSGPHPNPSPEGEGLFAGSATLLLGVTARVLGWRPDDFWAATPADVAAVLAGWGAEEEAGGVDRAGLAMMMEQCPDG